MHNETALLQRLKYFYQQRKSILINPPDGPDQYQELDITGVLHDNYGNFQTWYGRVNHPVWFDCHLIDSPPEHDLVILFLPKGKQRLIAQLKLLAGRVKPNTILILIGANDTGIKSAGKILHTYGCEAVRKIDTARHCQAWFGQLSNIQTTILDDLMTHWPISGHTEQTIQLASLPGTFAAGKLDPGSALLLDTLSTYLKQNKKASTIENILDFGCGSGLLSVATSQYLTNGKFDAVDIDAFAIKSCNKSFINNGINGKPKAIYLPNELQEKYHLIITNPPFHQGINTTTAATQAFIEHLPKLLTPNGQVWLVANRFLNYEAIFEKAGTTGSVVKVTSAYKVIQAQLK